MTLDLDADGLDRRPLPPSGAATVLLLLLTACTDGTEGPAPPAAITVSPPGQAIVAATRMRFAAAGLIADATCGWDFGDGVAAAGPTVDHVFEREGEFSVRLTVRHGTATATASTVVATRTLSGEWRDSSAGSATSYRLEQRGRALTGLRLVGGLEGTLSGGVAHPREVRFDADFVSTGRGGFCPLRFEGIANDTLDQITGTQTFASGCGSSAGQPLPVTLIRGGAVPPPAGTAETFTGVVRQGSFALHPFPVPTAGVLQARLTDVDPPVPVGLRVATWTGATCGPPEIARDDRARPGTILITPEVPPANYCVVLYDVGLIRGSVTYAVTVSHL